MTNWIKASEQVPDVGRLVIVRSPTTSYNNELQPIVSWEYDAGIVKAEIHYLAVSVSYGEYLHEIDKDTEWQYVEE